MIPSLRTSDTGTCNQVKVKQCRAKQPKNTKITKTTPKPQKDNKNHKKHIIWCFTPSQPLLLYQGETMKRQTKTQKCNNKQTTKSPKYSNKTGTSCSLWGGGGGGGGGEVELFFSSPNNTLCKYLGKTTKRQTKTPTNTQKYNNKQTTKSPKYNNKTGTSCTLCGYVCVLGGRGCLFFHIILYVTCFGRTVLYMCIEYHILCSTCV